MRSRFGGSKSKLRSPSDGGPAHPPPRCLQPLPITSSQMGHLLDVLEHAHQVLGLEDAAGGDDVFRHPVLAGSSSRLPPSWLPGVPHDATQEVALPAQQHVPVDVGLVAGLGEGTGGGRIGWARDIHSADNTIQAASHRATSEYLIAHLVARLSFTRRCSAHRC